MKVNGESIYSRPAGPFEQLEWGRCSQKRLPGSKTRLYLHVSDWPADDKLVVLLTTLARATARLLAGGRALPVSAGERQTLIALQGEARDRIASVIALDLDGPYQVVKPAP